MPSKVSISSDWTTQLLGVPTLTTHDYFGPLPPAPVPAPMMFVVHVDIPVPMFWPPGMALGQNKLAAKVLHKNLPIIQDGHDCGALIIHIPTMLPPPTTMANALLLLHIPFSGRKTNFSASTVISQGKATATAIMIDWPPTPMTSCFDPISPPTSTAFSYGNTVLIQLTLADLIIGWVTIGAMMIVEAAFAFAPPGADKAGKKAATTAAEAVAEGLVSKLVPDAQALIKSGLGFASGVARMVFTDGPVDAKFSVGSPFGQVEVGITRNADGNYDGIAGIRRGSDSGEVAAGQSGVSGKSSTDSATGNESSSVSSQTGSTSESQQHSLNPWSWGAPL